MFAAGKSGSPAGLTKADWKRAYPVLWLVASYTILGFSCHTLQGTRTPAPVTPVMSRSATASVCGRCCYQHALLCLVEMVQGCGQRTPKGTDDAREDD